MGICATGQEYYDRPALAIMLCSFEPNSFQVFSGLREPADLERIPMHFEGIPANFAVVHADPRTLQGDAGEQAAIPRIGVELLLPE